MAKKKTGQKAAAFESRSEMMTAIDGKYGAGSIFLASSKPIMNVPTVSTGSASLDLALGVGGVPKGRIIEVYGPEGSGKTTLTLAIVREYQRAGHVAAFVDAEHALDPIWAQNIGVDMDSLMISQPNSGEEALTIVEMLAASRQVGLVVIDSVAALVPQAEIDGEMGDSHIGAQARLMSQAMRKLNGIAFDSDCTIIFINQIRMKIGVMFGNPETTPGGRALKFYSSVRLDIRRAKTLKEGEEPVGNEVKVKVVKNKVAPPFKTAMCTLYYGINDYPYGIDYTSSLINLAVDADIIKKQGSWHNYGEIRLGNGFNATCTFVRENQDIMDELEAKIREVHGYVKEPVNEEPESEEIEMKDLEE